MPQASHSHSATHTPAYAAASLSMTHPALVWSQVHEQRQQKRDASIATTKPQYSSAVSIYSQSTAYSYDKEQPASESRSLSQRVKGFFH
ncbi:hypothetical protein F5Y19DRAFT_427561 [Xylariaceae sp. FL1651]|nr:hypothetical protein F5Y19DRAFT_427561 [Xylariaceae sp. FL1651]